MRRSWLFRFLRRQWARVEWLVIGVEVWMLARPMERRRHVHVWTRAGRAQPA